MSKQAPEPKETGIKKPKAAKQNKAGTKSESEAEKTVLKYLEKTNRPYGLIDIFNNLHGQVGKALLQKTLTNLSEKNTITVKTFGKTVVYVARQDLLEIPSQDEVAQMDSDITNHKNAISVLEKENKENSAILTAIQTSLTLNEARIRKAELEEGNSRLQARLDDIENGQTRVDPEQKKDQDKAFQRFTKLLRERKKTFKNIIDSLQEGTGLSKDALYDNAGVESNYL